MEINNALPRTFGGRLRNDAYHQGVNSIISTLRPMATLRTVAEHLNRASFLTPSGLPWTKARLTNYLRTTSI